MARQAGLTPTLLVSRRPVWEALSDMYLDTDASLSRDWRIRQLVASPYSITELENILINEAHQVCKYNLACIAGKWAGFDPEWLETKKGIENLRNEHSATFHD